MVSVKRGMSVNEGTAPVNMACGGASAWRLPVSVIPPQSVLAVHGCLEPDARLSLVFLNTKGPELCDAFDDVDAKPVTALHEQPLEVPKVA